jgi:hypothetical protein
MFISPAGVCKKARAVVHQTTIYVRRLSGVTARRIKARYPSSEFVQQLFSVSSPAGATGVPYAHYIDMTMAMVKRAWPAWATFKSESEYEEWIELEGASYRGAERVFTFSEATRRSIIEDYGAAAERVVVVGAAGHYDRVAPEERPYGSPLRANNR